MVRSALCSIPHDLWHFLKILPPSESAAGQVNCLRTPLQRGPEAAVVFKDRWDTKDAKSKKKR